MTTSVLAEGKIRVAANQGKPLPDGCIIDHQGRPSTDPHDFLGDPPGAILPLGGVVSYKGFCLSFIVELLGGALSGQGCASGEQTMKSNGVMINVYNIEFFAELETFFRDLEILIEHIQTSRIDPMQGEILLPGEPEWRTTHSRNKNGIPIDDTTWERIGKAARTLGLNPTPWNKMALG